MKKIDHYEKIVDNLIELTDNKVIEWQNSVQHTLVHYITLENLLYCFIDGQRPFSLCIFSNYGSTQSAIDDITSKKLKLKFCSGVNALYLLSNSIPSLHRLHLSIINQNSTILSSIEESLNSRILPLRSSIDSPIVESSNII